MANKAQMVPVQRFIRQRININSGQAFAITIGQGGSANGGTGTATTFGAYSSASGQRFDGYTDIANGDVFGR